MNQADRQHPEPTPLTSQVSAGQILSSRRQSWGLTVEEIAKNLNLGVETIEAIERDDYDRLPGSTFVKGYIRSYAKIMELDSEKVLETLNIVPEKLREIPTIKSSIKERGKTVPRTTGRSFGFFKWLLILILLAGIGLLALNLLPQMGVNKLSDLFQLEQSSETNNDLEIEADSNTGGNSDQKKSALIRIE